MPAGRAAAAGRFWRKNYKRIAVDGCGKPYLAGGDFFSLSHSGDYVILAVAGCRVGVDIEKVVSSAGFLEADCLTDQERAWLSEENSDRAFFELWTGKESVMKATGLGFRLSPKSVDVAPSARGFYNVLGKDWFLQWRDFLTAPCAWPPRRKKQYALSRWTRRSFWRR